MRLTRGRVLHGAVEVADAEGIDALTMRHLASELGVEAMSLYHHIPNKESVYDGMVELILEEIIAEADAVPVTWADDDWRTELRARLLAARRVQLRHKWAPGLIAHRSDMHHLVITWFDALLGVLHRGGFSWDLAHHALHAIGSYALGFSQELFVPASPEAAEEAEAMFEQIKDQYPNLMQMMAEVSHDDLDSAIGWCDDQTEFEFSIDVLIEGLEQRRLREATES